VLDIYWAKKQKQNKEDVPTFVILFVKPVVVGYM
jgi:hypothetical protein